MRESLRNPASLAFGALALMGIILLFFGCSSDNNPASSQDDIIDSIITAEEIDSVVAEIASINLPLPGANIGDSASLPTDTSGNLLYRVIIDTAQPVNTGNPTNTSLQEIEPSSGFTIPQDAATPADSSSEFELTIRVVRSETSTFHIHQFEFGPSGCVFDSTNPAVLTLRASAFVDENDDAPTHLVWTYYNTQSGDWDLEVAIEVDQDGRFRVPIYHFSGFRFALIRSGWISQGGQ